MTSAYISKKIRERVAEQARYRCGYCLCSEHIVGLSMELDHLIPQALGRATVNALHLNRPLLVAARRAWVKAGWHPPED